MLTLEETIELILKHRSDYDRKGILKMIEEKRQELGPEVINDESAAMIVARELNVDLHQMSPTARQKIEDITETSRNIALTVRVDNIGAVRTFTRKDGGGEGKVASLRVSDETGSIRVVLWDDLTTTVSEDLISLDDIIQLRGAYARKGLGDSIELSLGRTGNIRPLEKYEIEELGIDFGASRSEDMKIADLKDGLFGIGVKVKIQRVFPLSTFTRQRDQSEGKVLSMIAADESGTIRLVFWDDKAEEMENVEEGEIIRVQTANTRLNRDGTGVEVHVGRAATIERKIKEKMDSVEVAPTAIKSESLGMKSIADLTTGMWDVDIEGKVVSVYDVKTFTNRDGDEGRVRNVVLADESSKVRVTFWNDDVDKIKDIKDGDIIKILHGYVKEGFRGGVEFQVGRKAEITINPKGSKLKKLDVSQISDQQQFTKASRVLIGEIDDSSENMNVEICGIVVKLGQSYLACPTCKNRLENIGDEFTCSTCGKVDKPMPRMRSPIYQACPSCNKKLDQTNGGFTCKSCGKVDKSEPRMMYKITLDDGSGSMRITLFGKVAEELLQMTAEDADKLIRKTGNEDQPLIQNEEKVVGRLVSIYGRVKKYRESLDISANGFEFADPLRETKRIREEMQKELG
ncbi:MAG: OB-fold nucleic acid binding domain-containing protein [Candidatus Thorarchaeota archaeon]